MKFGGTSVENAACIRQVCRLIKNDVDSGQTVGVVVSAVAKMTKLLMSAVEQAEGGQDFEDHMHRFEDVHLDIVRDLFADHPKEERDLEELIRTRCDQTHSLLEHVQNRVCPDTLYARIVGMGEILSSHIVHTYLRTQGVDAAYLHAPNLIRTTGSLKDGVPDMEETERRFAALSPSPCFVMGGFIGADNQGNLSLLGMDGSDCSAAVMARAMNAHRCTLFKHDVDGVYTGDPNRDPKARFLPRLSFAQAHDMARGAVKVVHPGTLEILQDTGINIEVRNTDRPNKRGSVITDDPRVS